MAFRALAATLALFVAATALGWLFVPALNYTSEIIWSTSYLIPIFEKPARTLEYLATSIWMRYDSLWYQRIAEHGYEDISTPFYPMLPLFAAALGKLSIPSNWAVLLASRIATFFAVWGLMRLACIELGERAARRAVLFWLCWPMSFILLAGYSEPFLVAAMVWALLFAREGHWWESALCAILACLSRSTGIALLPALYWLAWRRKPVPWAPLGLASLGPFVFPVYLKLNGLMLPSQSYPAYWRTEVAAPWTTLAAAVKGLDGFVIFNLIPIVVFTILLFTPNLRTEYKILGVGMMLFLLTAKSEPPLHSMMRYSLAVFPAFIAMAIRIRSSWAVMLASWLMGAFNLLLLYFFYNWAYVV